MQMGIFARTFPRPGLEGTFDAVKSHGLDCLQFNFACLGLPTLPEMIKPELAQGIHAELRARSLSMAAVSGTCNLIHPDSAHRAECLRRLQTMIGVSKQIGANVVTLCTGTRDRKDMWQAHPDNGSPEAWRDLVSSLEALLPRAETHGVVLGIEPEPANVIHSARTADKLLREMKSSALKIIFDAANLVASREISEQRKVLSEACELLGSNIVLAHAKDLVARGADIRSPDYETVPAGRGQLDYDFYISILRKAGYRGALILHSLCEQDVPEAVKFLGEKLIQN
jgi:sugar phosphate isomerase/epimerase